MSSGTQYFVSPMQPGVRPQDPPDYDGISFVYVFTNVLTPWTQPAVNANVVLVVANSQGFVPGMTIVIGDGDGDSAGYYEVVDASILDRLTVMNFGTSYNAPPGTGFGPDKITTTSLPGPPGGIGPQGPVGPLGPPGPPLNPKGTVATSSALPASGNTDGDLWITADTGHGWSWNGFSWIDTGPYRGPSGPSGPQGAQGVQGSQGSQGVAGPQGNQGPSGPAGSQGIQGPQGNPGTPGATGPPGPPGGASAYTTLSAAFTMPAVNATAVASVVSGGAAQFNIGGIVYISPIGYLAITAVNTGTNQLTLQNLGYTVNQAPGSIASSGATLTGTGPQGPTGSAGSTGAAGPAGAAATVGVGTTTTGAAGTSAAVTDTGTPSAAVFNFTVPQGIQGVQGVQGTAGAAGATGATGSQGPAGATGSQGPAGPSAVSTDAGNLAKLGSDNLISVPQSSIWSLRLRSYNAIGNPNFEVDQRNCGVALGSQNTYSITARDRWAMAFNGSGSGVTAYLQSENVYWPGTNFPVTQKFHRFTLNPAGGSSGATDYLWLDQQVEGPNLRELITDVHSEALLVRSSVVPLSFGVVLRDVAASVCLTKLCTITTANTWTYFSLPNLPIWASGATWSIAPGNVGYILGISLVVGSTYRSPANDTWQTFTNCIGAAGQSNWFASPLNSTFDIAFVQHEPGSQCTPFIDKPFAHNLDECLRYFQKSYSYTVRPGTADGTGQRAMWLPAPSTGLYAPVSYLKPIAKVATPVIYSPVTGAANTYRLNTGDVAVTGVIGAGDSGYSGINSAGSPPADAYAQWQHTIDTGW